MRHKKISISNIIFKFNKKNYYQILKILIYNISRTIYLNHNIKILRIFLNLNLKIKYF